MSKRNSADRGRTVGRNGPPRTADGTKLAPLSIWAPLLLLLSAAAPTVVSGADWPTYRADAARSAHVAGRFDLPLEQIWAYTDSHAPLPAWPTSRRITFDRAMQPVSLGDRVLCGSTIDGSVVALDAHTGQVVWRFFTEGPVRFAPALWRDRALVASDDGHLYALRLADGALIWKRRGGPSQANVLGNERMISKWPMRGGPAVVDGIVYCASGIWPSDGIYLKAINADTGEVVWENSESGAIYMPQPHGGADARSGVAAQGYLVVSGERLFVPTGRAVPASFDRQTGEFEYFHLQKYGHNGESMAMVIDDMLFNGGVAFDVQGGLQLLKTGGGLLAAGTDGVVRSLGNEVAAYQWTDQERVDRKGKTTTARVLAPVWSAKLTDKQGGQPQFTGMITVGRHVVLGQPDRVSVFDPESRKIVWQAPVEGVACGLAVANNRLLVSTDQGIVYCFAASSTPPREPRVFEAPGPEPQRSSETVARAEEILQRTGVARGYCLDLGCGDGSLARELALRSQLQIIAVDSDPENVRRARQALQVEQLLGIRVTVLQRDPSDTGLPSYFADLIISQQGLADAWRPEADRLLRPHGGKLCRSKDGAWEVVERGALPGTGDWTHQYADPANTVNSDDQLIQGRLSMLWFRDLDFAMPSRHGRAPSPLFKDGRLFHEGLDALVAVDAYNGRELWRYDVPDVLRAYDGDELMGVSGTQSNFCIGGASVYLRDDHRCLRLDAKDGSLIGEFQAPSTTDAEGQSRPATWGYIAWVDGILYGSTANPEHVVTYRYLNRGGDMTEQLTESTSLFAIDTRTGEPIWSYEAQDSIRHNAIAIANGRVFLIDRPQALFDREKKPKSKEHEMGKLVALDARTGEQLWQNDEDICGTLLAASAQHNVLLMAYQPTRFRLDSEVGGRMTGFDADSGKEIWAIEARYDSRPTLNDRTIFVQGGAWDLLTGQPVPFDFERSYGCGILASSRNMLLFRSATLGYYDLSGTRDTVNYGGIRPGCWINALPAGGLVLMPDATSGCECSYLNKAWIALEPVSE